MNEIMVSHSAEITKQFVDVAKNVLTNGYEKVADTICQSNMLVIAKVIGECLAPAFFIGVTIKACERFVALNSLATTSPQQ